MKKIFRTILGGAFLLSLPMFLTSCQDILGEWDKPAPVNVTPETPSTPAADHSNQYIKYTSATDSSYVNIEGATEWTGTVTPGDVAAGTYVVSGTATCAGQLVLKGEVNIILKDGAKLTVDDGITYDITNNVGSLNIFGQGISSSMGQLIVNNNTPVDFGGGTEASAILAKGLSIHGGKVNATADTGGTAADLGGKGLEISGNIYIYNGLITATATNSQMGIIYSAAAIGSINILGGEVYAYSPGGQGISTSNAGDELNISGGKVTAKDTSGGGEGINCNIINITGGTVIAENGAGGQPAITCIDITISGANTEVTATGGNGDGTNGPSMGIAATNITIDNGTVIAIGGSADASDATNKNGADAINALDWTSGWPPASGDFKVNGGSLTATGGAKGAGGVDGKALFNDTGLGYSTKVVVATGLTYYENNAGDPSTAPLVTTPGDGTTQIVCGNRYVEIK